MDVSGSSTDGTAARGNESPPDKVRYSTAKDGLPFAYKDGQIITTQLLNTFKVLERLQRTGGELKYQALGDGGEGKVLNSQTPEPTVGGPYFLITGVENPLHAIMELRAQGIIAQPHHVHFTHSVTSVLSREQAARFAKGSGRAGGVKLTADPAYANPAYANPAYANPAYANPAYANPAYANPAYASPAYASPAYANPAYANPAYGSPTSPVASTDAVAHPTSAVKAVPAATTKAIWDLISDAKPRDVAEIYVLDTGLANTTVVTPELSNLINLDKRITTIDAAALDTDQSTTTRVPDVPFAAGHGTFIATLIGQVAPGCKVRVGRVLDEWGVGDEWTIAQRINALRTRLSNPERSILNLSFGAPVLDDPFLMAYVVRSIQSRGVVVIASAGNDSLARPIFPAALPGVIAVGALGPVGPAPFTNYGPWVDACSPGVDLVSCYFAAQQQDKHPDEFQGWAIWSGTSFSAAIVTGSLARLVMTAEDRAGQSITAEEARSRLIDAPWLMRIPDLGTVVNAW